jgi:hypothetical protein
VQAAGSSVLDNGLQADVVQLVGTLCPLPSRGTKQLMLCIAAAAADALSKQV